MQPAQLTTTSFAGYPPQAQALAVKDLGLLRDLPVVLLAILLKELMVYDWKMPAERRALDRQLRFLGDLKTEPRTKALAGFRDLPIPSEVSQVDWVNNPSSFIEKLTAWLWSTHRIDSFRALADEYAASVTAAFPEDLPAMPRLGIVVIGAGVGKATIPLFRKLRPNGVLLTRVNPEGGLAILAEAVSQRARTDTGGFLHWSIDGGAEQGSTEQTAGLLVRISYNDLNEPRQKLLRMIQHAVDSGSVGPEELRSLLARTRPESIGLREANGQGPLSHFKLSLLTEGAGTQIFATTFVQWAARECVRRAQPETLFVRYTPRQQAQTMNKMLGGVEPTGYDPEGSLRDADMGAYYTWLNMRRLSGVDQLRFLVWFEGSEQALAIGPGLPMGTTSDSRMKMDGVLKLLG